MWCNSATSAHNFQEVKKSFFSGCIEGEDAARLCNVKLFNHNNLSKQIGVPPSLATGDVPVRLAGRLVLGLRPIEPEWAGREVKWLLRRTKLSNFWEFDMIKGFQPPDVLQPETRKRVQWGPALGSGLIAGGLLLIVPRGSPWSALTFFSPVVMGRAISTIFEMPLVVTWIIHLAISIIYALLICKAIAGLRQQRAILTGGIAGLILYVVNFGVVSMWWPEMRGSEVSVVFTHVVFGSIVGGAYRGLLRRRPNPATPVV